MEIIDIEDRAGGPVIVGTRIAVDNVLLYLLDPAFTEEVIGRLLNLTVKQVSAARAYILTHPETVLTRHLKLEEQAGGSNPPEVIERAKRTHESLKGFRAWLAIREAAEAREEAEINGDSGRIPSFREWLAEHESHPAAGK